MRKVKILPQYQFCENLPLWNIVTVIEIKDSLSSLDLAEMMKKADDGKVEFINDVDNGRMLIITHKEGLWIDEIPKDCEVAEFGELDLDYNAKASCGTKHLYNGALVRFAHEFVNLSMLKTSLYSKWQQTYAYVTVCDFSRQYPEIYKKFLKLSGYNDVLK